MRTWNVIWTICRKDIGVWRRQPTTILATVLPALMFMVIIYFGAQAVGRNPVALVVEDEGAHAQQLAGLIKDSDAFVVSETSAAEAERKLRDVEVAAAITIPAGFERNFALHTGDPVRIEINNLNLDFTNDLRRALPAAITRFYAEQPDSPIAVQLLETDLRTRDVDLAQFDLVPNLVLLLTIGGVISAGLATAREWEEFTINELLLAPIGRGSLIAGKLLAGWLTTLLVGGIVLIIGAVTGLLRPDGATWWSITVLVGALIALASSGMGVALGAVTRSFSRTASLAIPLSLYLFFLSGGISVAAFLPDWVQSIARLTPTYYGTHALQMAIFYDSAEDLPRDLAVLTGTAIVAVLLGILSLRRSVRA